MSYSIDVDLGHLEVPKRLTKIIPLNPNTEVNEIKSNCTCIEIKDWVVKLGGLKIEMIVHSKSNLVVYNEKRLYLWRVNKEINESEEIVEEKLLTCQVNLKYT